MWNDPKSWELPLQAEEPTDRGLVVRNGVKIAYEQYGVSGPMLVLLPCWIIVHARSWKAQIADLSQCCRLLVIDGRGNGASDRPIGSEAYTHEEYVSDALAVMDHLSVGQCTLVGFSKGGPEAALIARARPKQIDAVIFIAPVGPMSAEARRARAKAFMTPLPKFEGWSQYNAHFIHNHTLDFLQFFFSRMFCEPHSTKQFEDALEWGSSTSAQTLVDTTLGSLSSMSNVQEAYEALECPVLLIHGDADDIVPVKTGREVAQACNAEMIEMPGSGHGPHLRHPAAVNDFIRTFLKKHNLLKQAERITRRQSTAPRLLYLSSPIGLGHARRDLAIARALRTRDPTLQIDWLAQDPVTRFLEYAGETCHGASVRLASESRHIEEEAGEHDLNVFEALRRMDEILVRNFRVLQDVLTDNKYDLVIADEAWDIDHFWHEHPNLKRAPLVWMTDFVGFAPMPQGGRQEAKLTADYNEEMVTHVERNVGVRDRSIFIGNATDVVDDSLGPNLPNRRAWTEEKFTFSGYVLGDDVPQRSDREELRDRLGFRAGEKVCVVTVGGSGVGAPLIRRILESIPIAHRQFPELRVIVITGPRLKLDHQASKRNIEFRGFELNLPLLLAACDLAIVQGGLSTCMELAAVGTPFIYFPLERHFEQNVHVRHRLERHQAGRRLSFAESNAEIIAAAICDELSKPAQSMAVERDGAHRAASLIADLL